MTTALPVNRKVCRCPVDTLLGAAAVVVVNLTTVELGPVYHTTPRARLIFPPWDVKLSVLELESCKLYRRR